MARAATEADLRQAHGRSTYARRMLDLLRRIPDRVERDSYVPQLAQLAGIDERVLREDLARGPRPIAVRPTGATEEPADGPQLSRLEREALTLVLLAPGLAIEQLADAELPVRDESARALAAAWLAAVRGAGGTAPPVEDFVASLDPVTAGLARDLLASARAHGVSVDVTTDREALRVILLRLRKERVQERLSDLQALIAAGPTESDGDGTADLERQFQALHLEREQLEQAINPSAALAGTRRA